MNTRKCPIVVVRCFAPLYKNGLVLISYKGIEVLPAKNLRYNVTCCVCVEKLLIVFVAKMAHCVKLNILIHHEDFFFLGY